MIRLRFDMNPKHRPVPFPRGSDSYRQEFLRLKAEGWHWRGIRQVIRCANNKVRWQPMEGEKCGAYARSTGKPCQAPALSNGLCARHGGLSTGPRTDAGKLKSLAAIGQKPRDKSWPPHPSELLERIRRAEKVVPNISKLSRARVVMGSDG